MGKELFKKVATTNKLKKRDFHKPDKVPRTYDRRIFTLDGKMELEIPFEDKVLKTNVYVKMDAPDELLLSEGTCRQLGIISYHPSVQPWSKKQQVEQQDPERGVTVSETNQNADPVVPVVRVQLLQSVTIPPLQCAPVQLRIEENHKITGPLLFEPPQSLAEGLKLAPTMLDMQDGIAYVSLANSTGFTQHLDEGIELGGITEVTTVYPEPREDMSLMEEEETYSDVKKITTSDVEWRRKKLQELFADSVQLPPDEKHQFCQLLMEPNEEKLN